MVEPDSPLDAQLVADYEDRGWWRDRTVIDDLLDHSARWPTKLAVIAHRHGDSTVRLTFAELRKKVDQFAGALLELGVRPGDVVSLQLPSWWQLTALHLACGRIGAVTNAILPILRRREVAFIARQLESKVLITPHIFGGFDYSEMATQIRDEVDALEFVFAIGEDELPSEVRSFEEFVGATTRAGLDVDLDTLRPDPNDIAQVQFTSGTTGEPKGVVHSWNTVYAGMRPSYVALGLHSDDVLMAFSPMSHTVGFYFGITMPICYGQTVVLQDRWDPAVALDLMDEHRVTWTMAATPFILDLCAQAALRGKHPIALRKLSTAGAPVPGGLVARVRNELEATLHPVWGMTEVGAVTSTLAKDPPERAATTDGRAMEWNELAVFDADDQPVPPGQVGRLVVRGTSLFVGYHRRPDLYQSAFCRDGWFDTGDLARQDPSGYTRLMGRMKDLVIRGGENIPVVEIEGILTEHPELEQIAIVGVPDDRLGERAAAVVVAKSGAQPTVQSLAAYLNQRGVAKQFWPEKVVTVDALPATPTGKIQKFLVRELAERTQLGIATKEK